MKVLHINTLLRGGAAKACLRLHTGLLRSGVDSKVLTLDDTPTDVPEVYPYSFFCKNKFSKISNQLKIKTVRWRRQLRLLGYPKAPYGFYLVNSPFDITTNPLYQEADIIHLHWVNDFLDYPSFFKKNDKKIVWTTHDISPVSGGQAFEKNFPFDEYQKLIDKQSAIKKELFNKQSITFVAPSKWMQNKISSSDVIPNISVRHIPNSLDTSVFQATSKEAACQQLRLPQDEKIILFVASNIDEQHKGMATFMEAVRTLYIKDLLLVIVGRFWEPPAKIPPYRYLGHIESEAEMSLIYSAADVYVTPAIEDNFPNTILESLACGTPVVALDTGGAPEQITHGVNGLLCQDTSPQALKNSMLDFFRHHQFDGQKISTDARQKYDLSIQAQQMKMLYSSELRVASSE